MGIGDSDWRQRLRAGDGDGDRDTADTCVGTVQAKNEKGRPRSYAQGSEDT
jgi:hypothetical protein